MTTLQKPVANSEAPVGTRAWAAALIAEFGTQLGTEYFNRQLSFAEATAEFRRNQPRVRGGFANRLGRSRAMCDRPEPTAPPAKPAKGFAAKLRFPGEERQPSPPADDGPSASSQVRSALSRAATATRSKTDPPIEMLMEESHGERKGFAAKLIFPHERRA